MRYRRIKIAAWIFAVFVLAALNILYYAFYGFQSHVMVPLILALYFTICIPLLCLFTAKENDYYGFGDIKVPGEQTHGKDI